MLKTSFRFKIKIFAWAIGIASLLTFLGQGCGRMLASKSGGSSLGSNSQCSSNDVSFDFKEGAETASIAYGPQVLDSMLACTGVVNPSQRTLDIFAEREASFSEFGSVMDVNPPLMMAHAALAAEVCTDLLTQEAAVPPTDRRIFNAVNLASVSTSISSAEISETIRRMSRACWGRDETGEESALISTAAVDIMNDSAAADRVQFTTVSICMSVLASLDGLRM